VHHRGEVAHVADESLDSRAALANRGERGLVIGAEVGRVRHDPSCDMAGLRRCPSSGRRCDGGTEGAHVAAHGLVAACEALLANLVMQNCGVGAALVPALVQVWPVRVNDGVASAGVDEELVDAGGVGESAHRVRVQLQLPGDASTRDPSPQQVLDGGVALPGANRESGLGARL
jgi:hypothetical protein